MNDTVTPAPVTLKATPEMEGSIDPYGYDGRSRIYTREHVDFDAFPLYSEGGPATISLGRWTVATQSASTFDYFEPTCDPDTEHVLHLSQVVSGPGEPFRFACHELNGTKYRTRQDASRAAFNAGCLGFLVYEKTAPEFGLPSAD